MGMTIDKAINGVEKRILPIYDNDADHQVLVKAIETMRKYQKIVQIMERTVDDGTSMYDTLQEIEEVIEDGNED